MVANIIHSNPWRTPGPLQALGTPVRRQILFIIEKVKPGGTNNPFLR